MGLARGRLEVSPNQPDGKQTEFHARCQRHSSWEPDRGDAWGSQWSRLGKVLLDVV